MILFAQKMYALTQLRASSINNGSLEFNGVQRKLLHTTTKYMTLLALAMISTWTVTIYSIIVNIFVITTNINHALIYTALNSIACIDSSINIICLYLQFPFNKNYYHKYCQCFGRCFVYLLTRNATNKSNSKDKNETCGDEQNTELDHKVIPISQTPSNSDMHNGEKTNDIGDAMN